MCGGEGGGGWAGSPDVVGAHELLQVRDCVLRCPSYVCVCVLCLCAVCVCECMCAHASRTIEIRRRRNHRKLKPLLPPCFHHGVCPRRPAPRAGLTVLSHFHSLSCSRSPLGDHSTPRGAGRQRTGGAKCGWMPALQCTVALHSSCAH